MVSFLADEGTSAERLIDAYEGLSAALRQPPACTSPLAKRVERLVSDLDRYASERGMDAIMAIALMDKPAVCYWTTRILGLTAEAGCRMGPPKDGRRRVTGQ